MKKPTCISASLLISLAGVAQKKTVDKYNVVFIISDEHRASVLGCYGDKVVKTPNIDALASQGVMFTRAYTSSPLSAPARASLITGTYPSTNGSLTHQIKVDKKDQIPQVEELKAPDGAAGRYRIGYKEGMITWGEYFKKMNYGTSGIGKMHVHGELQKGVNPEFPNGNLMGFDVSDMRFYTYFPGAQYKDYKNNPDYNNRYREIGAYKSDEKGNPTNYKLKPTLVQNEEDIFDFIVERRSSDYIENCVKKGEPFVAYVGLEKPHEPWSTEQRFYDLYDANKMLMPASWNDWMINGKFPYASTFTRLKDTLDMKRSMVAYYACVSEVDELVGKLIAKTKELGIYDKTIFVYTTDHGENLFEHGLIEKHCMFEPAVRIPLIISCPALLPQGTVCNSLASTIDILPTLAELLGGKPDKQWEGKSLVAQMKTDKVWDRAIFSEFYEANKESFKGKNVAQRMMLDNKYKYVYTHGMIDQLYDVVNDKGEMTNLALNPTYSELIQKYRLQTLNNWLIKFDRQMTAKAFRKGKTIKVEWEKVPEVKSYTVWRSSTPGTANAVKLAEVTDTQFNDDKVASKGQNYYWVTANWDFTRISARSKTIPMLTQVLPEVLPVTAMLTVN